MAYLKVKYKNGDSSRRLIAAKTKVAPLEATSTPRLELMAAVLAVKLAIPMKKILEVPETQIFYWTDSMNVLWWIKNKSRALKTFVGNRIAKIQKESSPTQWNYVKTDENPADLPSRGLTAEDLKESKLWWHRAEFLQYEENDWPKTKVTESETAANQLTKKKCDKKRWSTYQSTYQADTLLEKEEIRTNKIFNMVKTCENSSLAASIYQ